MNKDNEYQLDPESQKTIRFLGIRQLWCQDKAMQESMGSIVDRTHEHLGPSDSAIVRWRQKMLACARRVASGAAAPGTQPETHRVRPVSIVLPRDADWQAEIRARMATQAP